MGALASGRIRLLTLLIASRISLSGALRLLEAMDKVYGAKRLVEEITGPGVAAPKSGQP